MIRLNIEAEYSDAFLSKLEHISEALVTKKTSPTVNSSEITIADYYAAFHTGRNMCISTRSNDKDEEGIKAILKLAGVKINE